LLNHEPLLLNLSTLETQEIVLHPQKMLEGIGTYLYVFNRRLGEWSKEIYSILGRDPMQETINLADPNPYLDDQQRIMLVELSQLCIQTGSTKQGILLFKNEQGETRNVLMRFSPEIDSYGELVGISGTMQDLTAVYPPSLHLPEKDESYLSLINHLDEVVFSLDIHGQGVFVNPAWETLTERSLSYFIHVPFVDYVFEEDRELFQSHFLNLVSGRSQTIRQELRILKQNGEFLWMELHVRKSVSSGGKSAVSGTLMNIHQRKIAEAIVFNQRLAIENAQEGIAVLDKDGNYLYLNQQHVKLFGYENESDLLGKSWQTLYQKDEIERINKEVFPKLMTAGVLRFESQGVKKDGAPIFQSVCLTVLPDGGLICIADNITDQKRNEAELKEMALVASRTNLSVIISDSDGVITWVNDSFTQKTGYTLNEIVGQRPHTLLSGPDTDPATVQTIYEHLGAGRDYQGEILSYDKYGNPIWFYIDVAPVRNEKGELVKFIAVESDITLKKEAEANILSAFNKERELSELKTQFIHMASHEFRTPMASIQTSMDVLKHYVSNNSVQRDDLKGVFNRHHGRIAQEITRMSEIMNNVLLMGRLDAGKMVFNPVKTDLPEFFKNLIDEEMLSRDGAIIHYKVLGSPSPMVIDRSFMTHILKNLLSNAFKYGAQNEEPIVELKFEELNFMLTVTDNGIGIPESELNSLFQSFFRASNAEDMQGTGLGLVIIKQLTEMHFGTVSAESTLNRGSKFSILIPQR
jgi:PAS domain S-box-containing protein